MTDTLELFQVLVNQGHHDIIPFSYTIERGQTKDSTINFSYQQVSNSFPYSTLLSFNTVSASTTSTFVPETEDAKYKHEPIFYVDIMVEGDGVNSYSLRSQQESYVKENPTMTFNIPKFSWDNSIFGHTEDASESSVDPKEGFVWIGTSDNFVKKVYYNTEYANLVSTFTTPSDVHMITFGNVDNSTYVSCYDHLVRYICTSYFSGEDDFQEKQRALNDTNDLMILDDENSGYLISVESYQGKVIFRDRLTLEIVYEYDGFDAPFKVVWSKSHNCYLVAGTNTLWKLVNGQKTAVYNIKGYEIIDFDCSEKGVIGIIFKKDTYIIRFLGKNFYTMIYNEIVTDKDVRYCKYCEQGKFYVLQEVIGEESYSTVSYLFDSIAKTLIKTESTNSIATTTTTTTPPVPSSKIEIMEPTSSSIWQKGSNYDIKWISNASYNDIVKIELYKGSFLIDTIAEETGNTGIYVWKIANTYSNGSDYKLKATWITPGDNTNFDISNDFTITDIAQIELPTEIEKIPDKAIGIDYNTYTRQVVVVLSNGLIGIYDLDDNLFSGMFESGVSNSFCMAVRDRKVRKLKGVSKVRVYVGSEPYLSNMWDSGVVQTDKTSMYYGGGKNLTPGESYFVNIQVYSDKYGWSSVSSRSFIMPM